MRDIATQAGVATGLAYYYFESKDAIVLAFYQRAKDDLPELLEPRTRRASWRLGCGHSSRPSSATSRRTAGFSAL